MEPPPQTNKTVILLIVLTLAVNGTVGMLSLGYCLVFKVEPNVALLTAFIAIVNFLFGAVSGMLVKTSPTETTKQQPAPPSGGPPAEVTVVNPPSEPVPTTETKP